jgi:FAD/FMN-containing dehydrogenase
MNKLGQYLQQHLSGEVSVSSDARRYFSTDASIFSVMPSLIVYPRNENDVRKTARFSWQLAERGRVVPITARGGGSDQTGAAIGTGIIMAFPAHMDRVLEFDGKSGIVVVEPGINYGKLQQTLQTHGRFLPPYPASLAYATIGGAVANNAGGEKSVKYGSTRQYVSSLRVVLANGEVVTTGRLSKRELNKKLGLTTLEGEIYRALDTLLDEQNTVVDTMDRAVMKNSSGYDLLDVRHNDGSFDLTPLFVGSQGTLGIVTEVTLKTEIYNPETTLFVAAFDSLQHLQSAVVELRAADDRPSALEVVDKHLLDFVTSANPAQLKNVLPSPHPAFVLLVEYDATGRSQKRAINRCRKILEKYAASVQCVTDLDDQDALWAIRHASATIVTHTHGQARAIPIIEDGAVPLDKLDAFITGVYDIFTRNHLQIAVWGHIGDGNLHMQPYLDLHEVGDRQIAFRVMEEYYKLVIELGGTISGEHGDGRLRGPYLSKMYGPEAYSVLQKVKAIFDPHGILNPGVKVNVTLEDIKPLLRQEYSLGHLHEHLPRS